MTISIKNKNGYVNINGVILHLSSISAVYITEHDRVECIVSGNVIEVPVRGGNPYEDACDIRDYLSIQLMGKGESK